MDIKLRNERLGELRRVVEAAPSERFSMQDIMRKVPCGTAYCAGGWAALDSYFQNAGLEITQFGELMWKKEQRGDFIALEECFGLSALEAIILFGGQLDPHKDYGVKQEHVMANIDRMLAGEEPLSYVTHLKQLVPVNC